ncbi:MAG: DUF58 domain-containing protein [Salibacteraceae bacterium]
MTNLNRETARQFSSLELFARGVVEGFLTGMHKSPFHGFSVEFAEHRQYNKGESIRHIDWKLFGRTEKLFVKKYEEETNLRCQLVLDTSSSMYFPFSNGNAERGKRNKLDFAVHAAASLAYLFRKQRDAIGLTTLSNEIDLHLPARGSLRHQVRVFNELESLLEVEKLNKTSNLTNTLHELSDNLPKRSLVIVFSDLFDNSERNMNELFSAFQHMRHNKHEVILFNVLDNKLELDLGFENRPYSFVDPETGEAVKLNPLSVREHYQNQIKKFEHDIDIKCGQYHIDYNPVDIADGFTGILQSFLSKRKRMK